MMTTETQETIWVSSNDLTVMQIAHAQAGEYGIEWRVDEKGLGFVGFRSREEADHALGTAAADPTRVGVTDAQAAAVVRLSDRYPLSESERRALARAKDRVLAALARRAGDAEAPPLTPRP